MSVQKTAVSIVGARPQFIKLAPICRAFAAVAPSWRHIIIHTGQHYDFGMSDVFFEELGIPAPDIDLNVGSGSHAEQTSAMLIALETELQSLNPDCVVVYGDTNSTLAGALAASKLHMFLAHVEAGLRSFNRRMPEEINRLVADHCSDILFVPTADGLRNLEREGLADRARLVGDVMFDTVIHNRQLASKQSTVTDGLCLQREQYGVVTVHRPVNTSPAALRELIPLLNGLADDGLAMVWPMHPRTRAIFDSLNVPAGPNLHVVAPLSYLEMLSLTDGARLVLTDSGGLQKEAAFLGTPCITLREETEWVETLRIGANTLTGTDATRVRAAFNATMSDNKKDWSESLEEHYGNGDAAAKIVSHIKQLLD